MTSSVQPSLAPFVRIGAPNLFLEANTRSLVFIPIDLRSVPQVMWDSCMFSAEGDPQVPGETNRKKCVAIDLGLTFRNISVKFGVFTFENGVREGVNGKLFRDCGVAVHSGRIITRREMDYFG